MNKVIQNGYLILEHLSNIELYYTLPKFISKNKVILLEDEFKHAVKVMRNSVGDNLYVTDGEGNIYKSEILSIKKDSLAAQVKKIHTYKNEGINVVFCIPKLKNPDRLRFAIEKSVELGITSFKIFESKNTVSKTSNLKRLQKIAVAAMKQSLRSFLPQIEFDTFDEIIKCDGIKIIFDQNAKNEFIPEDKSIEQVFFIFGPEGGFDNSELNKIEATKIFNLANKRLRTETAVVKCASLLSLS